MCDTVIAILSACFVLMQMGPDLLPLLLFFLLLWVFFAQLGKLFTTVRKLEEKQLEHFHTSITIPSALIIYFIHELHVTN